MKFEEVITECQNYLLDEYDDEVTRDILGCKQLFYFIKEDKVRKYREEYETTPDTGKNLPKILTHAMVQTRK